MPRASYGYRLHYRTDDGDEYEELLGSADRRIPVVYEVPHRKSRCSTRMVRHSFATPTEAFEDLRPVAIHSSEARSTRGSYPTSRADLSGLPRKVGGRIEQQHGHQ